ncbi:MAG: insulinase family protein [Bacteroidales bacterium]|nr:insulinase family protein [Bacteroidales bacterium]
MKKIFAFISFLILTSSIQAQDLKSPVPFDPGVITGKLENGLTYYIRSNPLPEKRAEFYLVVNAGAILEDADQNGLAHFTEHMAFNGTKHFEKHQIIQYLQSIGMKFGPEINAFTSHDVTAYMLQKVPVEQTQHIDTALLVLYDWASAISFENEEIDNERGVIHEEWRTGKSAMERMNKKASKKILFNSKYAEHDVIGDINIIDKFDYPVIKRFFSDWYRPDLQAIIAVGDFDPLEIKAKIEKLFAPLSNPEKERERHTAPVPDHDQTLVSIEMDKEAQYSMVQVYYKHNPVEIKDMGFYRENLKHELFNEMMRARLDELTKSADPPFVMAYTAYTQIVKSKDAYVSFAITKGGEAMKSLKALLIENERVKKFGFTATELSRAKDTYLKNIENAFNERNKKRSDQYVWDYFGHFLNGDPVPGTEKASVLARTFVPDISLEEINQLSASFITSKNRVIAIQGPEKEDLVYPTETEVLALVDGISQEKIEAYVDNVADKPLIQKALKSGLVISEKTDGNTGITEWNLSNGIKIFIKPTDFKDDEILMQAYSPGGYSLYPAERNLSATYAASICDESGLGSYDAVQIQKFMSGKIVSMSPFISELQEGFRGNCSNSDLETMMQMIHVYFTEPRLDSSIYLSFNNRMKGFLENNSLNPASALQDTILVSMSGYSPFRKPMSVGRLSEIDLKDMENIYKERFMDANNFVFFFTGSIDMKEFRTYAKKYLASLPQVKRIENWQNIGIRPLTGKVSKEVIRNMKDPKATVYISLWGDYQYTPEERIALAAINDILSYRYIETIREEEGGTYGAGVWTNQNKYPESTFQLNIRFDCDPENVDKLCGIVLAEIEKLRDNGPDDKQLQNFKENKLKTRAESLKENRYWLQMMSSKYFEGESFGSILEYDALLKSLSRVKVQEIAKKYLTGENTMKIVLLPDDIGNSAKNPNMIRVKE